MRRWIIAAALLIASPAAAQDLIYDFAHSRDCVAATDDWYEKVQCIGTAANRCMEDTPGGYSTVGQGACVWAEYEDWDAELNALYGPLRARLANDDEVNEMPVSTADALRDAQRAWIPWRDANCAFERSKWGGGAGGGPASAACLMQMTGERALSLRVEMEFH
ncbi:lysozyme inhibitor LprI family protein [Maritimibacter sp. UBA3975]|uniref:lysozyme inhibitor LprI family protein n=1 Tax=Maritimibacter sp. UBA3975 TaxID=1946833 RepID=UPI000C0BB808|nr:lysozyme inhibitor LprI family protein [Maritimibacter sp. UBA3975]MAM61693.1 hypothetical protein [Maritimibacter sp.]|tara:strand:- start:5274 stop:5762 length:489 start_codon:yes stop_codon:yes gene_type:complete